MITASIVLFNTLIDQLIQVINYYRPNKERLLFLYDNSEIEMTLLEQEKIGVDGQTIIYYHNDRNLGYGAAHNIGICRAEELGSVYHIVLNPDIMFDSTVIDKLVIYADTHKDVAYMLPKVVYTDGSTQYLCKLLPTPVDLIFRRFFPPIKTLKKWNEQYELRMSGYDKIFNPPCLSGCFMFMRVSTLMENKLLFDESYFMYCEDFDLIRRIHRYGKTIFYPYATIVHKHAKESYKNKKMLMLHIRAAIKYFNKFGWIIDRERDIQNKKILNELKKET